MILRRRVVKLPETEAVANTINRLESLADHLEVTAQALEELVDSLRNEEEVQDERHSTS